MDTLDLIKLVATIIIGVGIGLYFLVKAIKNRWLSKLANVINEGVKYAEDNIKGPEAKENYVMQKVEESCSELGIPYGLIKGPVRKLIKLIVAHYNVIKKGVKKDK